MKHDVAFDPGYQVTYGALLRVEKHPFPLDKLVLMDYRDEYIGDDDEMRKRNERFPTWHPEHKPDFDLECLKDCDIEVKDDDWSGKPGAARSRHATLHRGRCARCRKSVEKVANNPFLRDVATFSARNNWDPLFGIDVGAAYKEWLCLSQNATVVESMLVSPSHMQVSVCHLRTKANQATGILGFHKNVICFPQAVDELEAFLVSRARCRIITRGRRALRLGN